MNGADRRGPSRRRTDALNAAAPTIAFGRPYTPDFVGWMDDFSTTGGYDANGGFSRAWINLSELLYGAGPKLQAVPPLPGRERAARRATAATSSSATRRPGARLRPEPEVGGPVIADGLRPRPSAGSPAAPRSRSARSTTTTAGARPTSCSSTTRSGSPRAATSRSRACARERPPTFKVTRTGGRPFASDRRGHGAGARRPAHGRTLRDPAAVADRRVLRGLPARHLATSGSPTAGACP